MPILVDVVLEGDEEGDEEQYLLLLEESRKPVERDKPEPADNNPLII